MIFRVVCRTELDALIWEHVVAVANMVIEKFDE